MRDPKRTRAATAIWRAAREKVWRDINSYQDTVTALICFGHALTWDDTKKCAKPRTRIAFGRSMDPSPANKVQSKEPVTPDLVTVCGPEHGVVAEAKVSFHGTLNERDGDIRQLLKYDDDLKGWPISGEKIKNHDVVLLVHYSRKGDTEDILKEATAKKQLEMDRNFAAVCFTRMPQADEFMSLECFWGGLTDKAIQKRMRPLPMPLEKVQPLYPIRLYDASPPPALLLQLAWDYVFSGMVAEDEYLGSGKKVFEIECTVDQIRQRLAQTCGPAPIDDRDPPIPCRDWVVKMFKQLEVMRLAKCVDKSAGRYIVYYRRKQMALDFFIDKLITSDVKRDSKKPRRLGTGRKRSRKHDPNQGVLFQ